MDDTDEQDRCSGCVFKIECLLFNPSPCTVQNLTFDKLFKIYSPTEMRKIVSIILSMAKR